MVNWPSAWATVFCKLVDSGFAWLAVVASLFGLLISTLGSEGLPKFIHQVLDTRWFCATGWTVAVVVTLTARLIFRWQERTFDAKLDDRIRHLRQPELLLPGVTDDVQR